MLWVAVFIADYHTFFLASLSSRQYPLCLFHQVASRYLLDCFYLTATTYFGLSVLAIILCAVRSSALSTYPIFSINLYNGRVTQLKTIQSRIITKSVLRVAVKFNNPRIIRILLTPLCKRRDGFEW